MIESQVKENTPTIQGIQKLKSQDIRIHCNTAREAEQLRKLKWDKAYNGFTVRQPKYGIVVWSTQTNYKTQNLQKNWKTKQRKRARNKRNEDTMTKTQRQPPPLLTCDVLHQPRYGWQVHQTRNIRQPTVFPNRKIHSLIPANPMLQVPAVWTPRHNMQEPPRSMRQM